MKLRDLSREEALALVEKYLKDMMDSGVRYLSDEQNAVANGLFFHASNLLSQSKLNSRVDCIREAAENDLEKWEPLVAECEPYVNEYLANL